MVPSFGSCNKSNSSIATDKHWIKGFNQVSSAAALDGIELELTPSDMYDICAFLRKHKEKKSPRYMKWILEPQSL